MDSYYSDEIMARTVNILREYQMKAFARPLAIHMNPVTWHHFKLYGHQQDLAAISIDSIFGIPVQVDYNVPPAELEFSWKASDARVFSETAITSVRTRDNRLLIDAV